MAMVMRVMRLRGDSPVRVPDDEVVIHSAHSIFDAENPPQFLSFGTLQNNVSGNMFKSHMSASDWKSHENTSK